MCDVATVPLEEALTLEFSMYMYMYVTMYVCMLFVSMCECELCIYGHVCDCLYV